MPQNDLPRDWSAIRSRSTGVSGHAAILDGRARALVCLHERLMAGDAAAVDDICLAVMASVLPRMLHRWQRSDRDRILGAIDAGLMAYLAAPGSFEPRLSPLDRYIECIATRKMIDEHRAAERRRRAEQLWAAATANWVQPQVRDEGATNLGAARTLVSTLDERERRFVAAKLEGERRTEVLAVVLDIGHLEREEQRLIVHRTWVRLRKRLRRAVKATIRATPATSTQAVPSTVSQMASSPKGSRRPPT
jgi:DNA-directed RNA polymerase specialized sigma24 family protein